MSAEQHQEAIRKIALTGVLSAMMYRPCNNHHANRTAGILCSGAIAGFLLECGIRFAWAGYIVTSLAGFIAVPEKLNILPYIAFFGIYTVVKYHIESLRKVWLEILLKLAAFNLFLWPAWGMAKAFLPESLTMGWGVPVVGAVLQILFLLYDYLFTLWIRFYFEKIAPKVKRG